MNTDLTLLTRYHRDGDADAFQDLMRAHAGMVFAAARRITQDAALAEEVAQDTFLALARRGVSIRESVAAWLHHVARQKACNALRGELRRQRHEQLAAEALQEIQEDSWAELEPVFDEALEELPEAARALLIERFLEGRTQQEVAQRQGVSQSTVSRLLNDAVAELRGRLKAKGAICGGGLALLLSAHGVQAAPPTLLASLGKLALSGAGAATPASASLTALMLSLFMKSTTTKIAWLGCLALMLAGAGYDLASNDPWLLRLTKRSSPDPAGISLKLVDKEPRPVPGKHGGAAAQASTSALAAKDATGDRSESPSGKAAMPENATSPQVLRQKLALFHNEADFRAMIARLYALGNPRRIADELRLAMGLDLDEKRVATMLQGSAQALEFSLLAYLASKFPQEALAWLATMEGSTISTSSAIFTMLLKSHPEITAESMAAILPAGPNRDLILSTLRAQTDPMGEAQRLLASQISGVKRGDALRSLAEHWPPGRASEAAAWAMQNLDSNDLLSFLPRLASHLSSTSPDEALHLLGQINDPVVLKMTFVNSLYGLLHDNSRVRDVLPLLDNFQGKERAFAIAELTRRWVRTDQEGLVQWINSLDSASDFEAALPLTLAQLSPDNYAKAMTTLMSQLDPGLETALIKAATPDFGGSARTTMDIIGRLALLPQYQRIGSGQQGNQELLWQAVNTAASQWASHSGAPVSQGAQWIDSLTFNTPADKAAVAARLYNQWKISDPTAAAQWAAGAGVKVP